MSETAGVTKHRESTINMLPDELLLTIVDKLSVDDAVKTAFLSERWKDIWKHISIINFGPDWVESTGKEIVSSINQFIRLHRGEKVDQFGVEVTYTPEISSFVDSWIQFALRKDVQKLNLDFNVNNGGPHYQLAPSVFNSQSLISLKLAYCDLKLPASIQLQSLHEVYFHRIELPDNAIHTLTSNAPRIEDLYLTDCNRSKDIWISVPPGRHLNRLVIYDSPSVYYKRKKMVLNVPSVTNLAFLGCLLRSEYHLQDITRCSSLVQFTFDDMFNAFQKHRMNLLLHNIRSQEWGNLLHRFLSMCRLANSVHLSYWCIQLLTFRELNNYEGVTLNCTSLEITTVFTKSTLPGIIYVLRACPLLKNLTIRHAAIAQLTEILLCFVMPHDFQEDDYVESQIDSFESILQHLETVQFIVEEGEYQTWNEGCFRSYQFFKGSRSAYNLAEFLKQTATNLKSVFFKTSKQCHEVKFPID